MLAEEEDNEGVECRQFFSLYNGMLLKKRIPKARGKGFVECMGWLITVGKDEGEINLLHPFSGVQIELPHQRTFENYEDCMLLQFADKWSYIRKAVLSANPSHTSDYVLMVIEGTDNLSFWRPGDLTWTRVMRDTQFGAPHLDIVYYDSQFYAVDFNGRVMVCNIDGPEPPQARLMAELPSYSDRRPGSGECFYIVESLGSLFVVARQYYYARHLRLDRYIIPLIHILDHDDQKLIGKDHEKIWVTTYFQVFKLDLTAGILTKTMDLGDIALFLGSNASISVQASQFPGIKPNHIYFTDNDLYKYRRSRDGGGLDMGVFNLADGSIEAHYEGVSLSHVCPPTWVTPTLY